MKFCKWYEFNIIEEVLMFLCIRIKVNGKISLAIIAVAHYEAIG